MILRTNIRVLIAVSIIPALSKKLQDVEDTERKSCVVLHFFGQSISSIWMRGKCDMGSSTHTQTHKDHPAEWKA